LRNSNKSPNLIGLKLKKGEMMNKTQARKRVIENDVTYGELQDLINNADPNVKCKINKNITRTQALDIMRGAFDGKERDHKFKTWRYDLNGKLKLTPSGLTAMNIFFECS
jgi:hypothetical protein